jgi:hypothetical protein
MEKTEKSATMRENGLPQNRGDLFGDVVHVQSIFIWRFRRVEQ